MRAVTQPRIDFSKFRNEQTPVAPELKTWYVVLMMDRKNDSGHTSIKVMSNVRSLLGAKQPGSKNPAIIICTGPEREAAVRFKRYISKDSGNKQIRGIHSRGANADIYSTLLKYEGWIDTEVVFGVKEEEVNMIRYTVKNEALETWLLGNRDSAPARRLIS
jgi:hypothetical protein